MSNLSRLELLQVLGELPTKSGAFPLCAKIQQQLQAAEITHAPLTTLPAPKE